MRNTPPIETINKKSTCRFQFLGLQFVSHLRILHVLINKGEVWNLLQLKWQKSRNSRKLQAFLFFYHGKIAKWEYTEKCCEAWIVVLSAVKSLSPVQQAFLHNPCVSAAISQWNLNFHRFLGMLYPHYCHWAIPTVSKYWNPCFEVRRAMVSCDSPSTLITQSRPSVVQAWEHHPDWACR